MSVLLILKWLAELIATTAEEGAVTETAGSDPSAGLFRVLIYGLVLASSAAQFAIVPVMPTYAHPLGPSGLHHRKALGSSRLATLASFRPAGAPCAPLCRRKLPLWAGRLFAS